MCGQYTKFGEVFSTLKFLCESPLVHINRAFRAVLCMLLRQIEPNNIFHSTKECIIMIVLIDPGPCSSKFHHPALEKVATGPLGVLVLIPFMRPILVYCLHRRALCTDYVMKTSPLPIGSPAIKICIYRASR
jgi:hypothetical protein